MYDLFPVLQPLGFKVHIVAVHVRSSRDLWEKDHLFSELQFSGNPCSTAENPRATAAHLDIMRVAEELPAEGVERVHGALHQVASDAPHVAEDKHGADEGVELGGFRAQVNGSLLAAQQ